MDTDLELLMPLCRALIVLTAGVVPVLPNDGLPKVPQSEPTCITASKNSRIMSVNQPVATSAGKPCSWSLSTQALHSWIHACPIPPAL